MDPVNPDGLKAVDTIKVFWLRKVSPYVTRVFLLTPITPNQTTALWGVLCVSNSYLIYRAIVGHYWLIPVIALVYVVGDTIDCVDGEIARRRNMSNPIGGKLMDGVCHRATEYSVLAAFVAGAQTLTGSRWVLPVGMLLFAGDAMYTYVYERRVTALRVHAGFTGAIKQEGDRVYTRGTRWSQLKRNQKIATITGQIHNKSIYAVIAISYVSSLALLVGLALLALYKNWKWIRLIRRTLAVIPVSQPGAATEGAITQPSASLSAG
jgi:phosphatidylglycerophosphate synthase